MSKLFNKLSKRERQIMDVIYQNNEATVAEVQEAIPNSPSYSSVRALIGILEKKGYLKHKKIGRAFIYSPIINHKKASQHALKQVAQTFFDDSIEHVVAALISMKSTKLTDEEYARLSDLIKSKQKEDKNK